MKAVLAQRKQAVSEAAVLYLDVHANPELSGAEERTAALLAAWLRADGLETATNIGGHGVLGALRNGEGPTVLLRAELDALPVREQTGLPYASTVTSRDGQGIMHACGHDLHLAALAGASRLLAANRRRWRGTLLVAGQPAEETLTGARAMIEDGLLDRFGRPEVALAQHTAPLLAGMVAHGTGAPVTAAGLTLAVTVPGRGGHAGAPHLTIDPVITAAAIVLRLQAVVAREIPTAEQAVLSVTDLRASGGGNLVPDHADLTLTIRAPHPATVARVRTAAERVIRAECAASGTESPALIATLAESPANTPDPAVSATVRRGHEQTLGADRVASWPTSMATEDFGQLAAAGVRTSYWMLGSIGPRQWAGAPGDTAAAKLAALPANHSPRYAPDLAHTLPTGITALVVGALTQLGPRPS
jgi:amidohydrolase